MPDSAQRPTHPGWRQRLYDIIFESDTPAGRGFDVLLLIAILASVTAVSLETIDQVAVRYGSELHAVEIFFTGIFTIEYLLRIACVRRPTRYIFSFWGAVDLASFLPTYLMGVAGPMGSFFILRSVRLLRVFRILKLVRMLRESEELRYAVWQSRDKIAVFIVTVLVALTISGTLMYYVEGIYGENTGFSSIPQSMYWAIITMTTVGYGDVVPKTVPGKFISSLLILLGYSLIIVPTGFVSAELTRSRRRAVDGGTADGRRSCPRCARTAHAADANYCDRCGERLLENP